MDIHGARTDSASARQGYPGAAESRQQRAENEKGSAHLTHEIVGSLGGVQAGRVQGHVATGEIDFHAHVGQELVHAENIVQAWDVM